MTDTNPNRVLAGKSGVGRYDFKRNSEAEIDLVDEETVLEVEDDYRMKRRAPSGDDEDTPSIDNIADIIGEDVYEHPEWYTDKAVPDPEAVRTLRRVRGNPDALVSIYRAVPKGVSDINKGDWVSISKEYADYHGGRLNESGEYDLIETKVKASTLFSEGNGLEEFGYDGTPVDTTLPLSRQYSPDVDIRVRSEALNNEMLEEFKKNPTVEKHLELLRANADIIAEVVEARKNVTGGSSQIDMRHPIPGYQNILAHMDAEYKNGPGKPEEIGGVRVRRIAAGIDKTFEVMPDKEPAPGRSVDTTTLTRKVSKALVPENDYNIDRYLQNPLMNAGRNGRAITVSFSNDKKTGALNVEYLVVEAIHSRRSDFVENHGGAKPIADGWL